MSRFDAMKPAQCPVVKVEWEDITHYASWNDVEDDVTTTSIVTVGWLLERNEKHIVIAASYDSDSETWADYNVFPNIPPHITVIAEADE